MRLFLSILLINLIFVSNNFLFGKDIILSDKEMKEYTKSFYRLEKYYRYLQQYNNSIEQNKSEDPNESEFSANITITDTDKESTTNKEEPITIPAFSDEKSNEQNSSIQEPPSTQRPAPKPIPKPEPHKPIPVPPGPNREASIHIIGYNNFQLTPQHPEPAFPNITMISITFNLFVYYYGYTPFKYILLTLKIITKNYRILQEGEGGEKLVDKNATALCEYNSFDNENGFTLYDCYAETDVNPLNIQSYNDFKFKVFPDGDPLFILDSEGNSIISLNVGAAFSSLNLMNQTSNVNKFVTLNNGYVFSNDSEIFYIRGNLEGQHSDKIADKNQINFTFSDFSNVEENIKFVNVICLVTNHDLDNFELKCEPEGNLTSHLYESSAVIDDIYLTLNMTEQDYVCIVKINQTNKGINLFYQKSSRGLSGGAIAGIVIACAVVLIIIIVIAILLRRHKVSDAANSTVVELKKVDNHAE